MILIRNKPSLLTVLRTLGFPGGTVVKNHLPMQDMKKMQVQTPGSGRSPGVGNGNSLQYSCLEKSHGQRRTLEDYSLWGHKELDMTE